MFYSDLAFLDAGSASNPIVKSPKQILDDACRTGGMVKTGQHVQSASNLIKLNISQEEMDGLIQTVFEAAPDEIVGHKLCRLIARARNRVLENYEVEEAGQ